MNVGCSNDPGCAHGSAAQVYLENHVVKLSLSNGTSEDSVVLGKIEPGNENGPPIASTIHLVAQVYDQNGNPASNVDLELKLTSVPDSGGHFHGDNGVMERTGKLSSGESGTRVTDSGKALAGNTGSDGLRFTYSAPEVSGDIKITARCTDGKTCTQEGPDTVWVGVKDLDALTSHDYYALIGQTDSHPVNHYLTFDARQKVTTLAFLYKEYFPKNSVLHLNDASLERGGLFDVKADSGKPWRPPHSEHRRGTVIDIRANLEAGAIPPSSWPMFESLAADLGAEAKLERFYDSATGQEVVNNRHYHVRLAGRRE